MRLTNKVSLLFVLIFSFLTISCEDDTVSSQEEHFEAIGTAIYDATGALSVSILRGVTSDTLFVTNGELSDHFDVKFYNEDEIIVDPPESEGIKLAFAVADESIVEFWQHEDEQGEFEFHLRGLNSGVTSIELFIEHEGHNDYRSGDIPVVVK